MLARINENAKNVADAVKAKLEIAQQALPKGVTINPVYDRTELVEKALKTAESALLEGSILVAIVLFLFLGENPLGHRGGGHLAAGDADRLHPDAIRRHVGQPDVARRPGHRHRHDGRRRGGDGGEQVPPAGPPCRPK